MALAENLVAIFKIEEQTIQIMKIKLAETNEYADTMAQDTGDFGIIIIGEETF